MKNSLALLFLLLVAFAACKKETEEPTTDVKKRENDAEIRAYLASHSLNATATESGLYYLITQANPGGTVPDTGSQLTIQYRGSLLNGQGFDSIPSFNNVIERRYLALFDRSLVAGVHEGLRKMRTGEEAILLVPSHLGFGGTPQLGIPAWAVLRYDMKLLTVQTQDQVFQQYIADSLSTVTPTPTPSATGLYRIITQAGSGTEAVNDKTIKVKYKGFLRDGTLFDQSGNVPFSFVLGKGNVIKGWDEAFVGMREGDKATLLIPYAQAYNAQGQGRIRPYTPLIFQVELVDVVE